MAGWRAVFGRLVLQYRSLSGESVTRRRPRRRAGWERPFSTLLGQDL